MPQRTLLLKNTALLSFLTSITTSCALLGPAGDGTQAMQDPVTQERLAITDVSDPEDFGPSAAESGLNPTQFSRENLMDLLVAEIAAREQQFDIVLENYAKVAQRTHDEAVVTRAFGIAQYLKDEETLSEMTFLWAEIAPDNIDVQQQAAFELAKKGDISAALTQMEAILELGGATSFDRVALQAKALSPEKQTEVLGVYEEMLSRHPDNDEMRYGYAVMQESTGDREGALQTTQVLLDKSPENAAVITLMASLLQKTEGIESAVAFLSEREELLLQDAHLGNFYARALIENKQLEKSESVYQQLTARFPDAYHLKLALALVSLENRNLEQSKDLLNELVNLEQHRNEAHFYLARIAEIEEAPTQAIYHYNQVLRGGNFYNALARSTFLMIEGGEPEKASERFHRARQDAPAQAEQIWELEIGLYMETNQLDDALNAANRGLTEYPGSENLLYTRAMLQEQLNDLESMEKDLQTLIDSNPNNATALNALGYTLANRGERLEEAYELITRAHKLEPDNPAIIDSLGWVLFRMGQIDEAQQWIEIAYESFPDAEVGAHLAEILWTQGRRQEALIILRKHYNEEPDHRILNETFDTLGINPATDL